MDRGAWRATACGVVKELDATEQLNNSLTCVSRHVRDSAPRPQPIHEQLNCFLFFPLTNIFVHFSAQRWIKADACFTFS